MKYNLHRWKVVDNGNPYHAPEQRTIHLWGYRDQDTKPVLTSRVVTSNGREVTTKSGSIYVLQDMDPDYLDFLIENNYDFDEDNPIKIKEK